VRPINVASRYATIALVASATNLVLQSMLLLAYSGPLSVEFAAVVATAIVLPFKYVADKRFIFNFTALSPAKDLQHLALYSSASVFTVAIFWGFEFAAWRLLQTRSAQYVGGALGLAVSFYVKYVLDKRFVFK
jgi:putative flippase GtrA